jgi:uncharacterized protein YndB with AHSA1/START domain
MTAEQVDLQLMFSRILDASPDRVWRLWTDERLLRQWLCPSDCQQFDGAFNVRVGGPYRFTLQCKGKEYTAYGSYLEVSPIHRLAFTQQWESPNSPETRCTITLIPVDGKTELHFHQSGLLTEESVHSHERGWALILDHLGAFLDDDADAEAA